MKEKQTHPVVAGIKEALFSSETAKKEMRVGIAQAGAIQKGLSDRIAAEYGAVILVFGFEVGGENEWLFHSKVRHPFFGRWLIAGRVVNANSSPGVSSLRPKNLRVEGSLGKSVVRRMTLEIMGEPTRVWEEETELPPGSLNMRIEGEELIIWPIRKND